MTPLLADGLGTPDTGVSVLLLLGAFVFGWVGVLRLRGRAFPRVPRPVAWSLLGLAVGCTVLAVVLPPIIRPDRTANRPSSDAHIRIVSPANGATFRGDPATVQVQLSLVGGTIVARTSTRLTSDQGHVHLYLDGALVSMAYALQAELRVVPGAHRLTAEFVALDHAPFAPRVVSIASFIVEP
jgi:hypothetical protein